MTDAKKGFSNKERLYPTDKEERVYREQKERYGLRDAVVVKGQPDEESSKQQRNAKERPA